MNDGETFFDENEVIDYSSIDRKADAGLRWNSISLIYSAITKVLLMIILARLFTPREYGVMGLVLIIIGFGMLFSDIGVSGAIIHYQKVSQQQLSTLYWLSFIIGFSIFLILILIAPLISMFYSEPDLTLLIRFTAIIFLITPLGQQFETLFRKELKFRSLAYIEIFDATIIILVSTILAFYNWGVISVLIAYLCKSFLKSSIIFFIGLKIWKPTFEMKFSEIRKFLSFGMYQMGERSLNYFNSNIDKILIGKFLGTISLGYYNIAYNLILYPITLINPIFTRVSFPYFSKIQNNIKILKEKYLDLINIISSINFPIYLLLIVIAPYFVPLLYGPQWYPSIILVQILSVVGIFRCIGNPLGSLLYAKGYARLGFLWNAIGTMIFPAIVLLGIILGGINGVALFIILSNLIFFYLNYRYLIRKILNPCFKEYLKSFGINLIFSVLASLLSLLGGFFFQTPILIYQLLYHILMGGIGYICLIFIFKRQFLMNFIKRFLKKNH